MFLKSQPHENQLREVVTKAKIGKLVATKGIHESHVKKGKTTYINPFNFHFPLMPWSGDFVAKWEKGDCVALQEEGMSVYTRFKPSSGLGVAGSSLVVFWTAVLFLAIVSKVSLYHCHVFCLMLRLYIGPPIEKQARRRSPSWKNSVINLLSLCVCCLCCLVLFLWICELHYALYAIHVNVIE